MDAVTTLDGVKMIALAYRAKSENGKKAKAKRANFLSTILSTFTEINKINIFTKQKKVK